MVIDSASYMETFHKNKLQETMITLACSSHLMDRSVKVISQQGNFKELFAHLNSVIGKKRNKNRKMLKRLLVSKKIKFPSFGSTTRKWMCYAKTLEWLDDNLQVFLSFFVTLNLKTKKKKKKRSTKKLYNLYPRIMNH